MKAIRSGLVYALISGALKKEFAPERAVIMAVDYMLKGLLYEVDVTQVIDAMPNVAAKNNG